LFLLLPESSSNRVKQFLESLFNLMKTNWIRFHPMRSKAFVDFLWNLWLYRLLIDIRKDRFYIRFNKFFWIKLECCQCVEKTFHNKRENRYKSIHFLWIKLKQRECVAIDISFIDFSQKTMHTIIKAVLNPKDWQENQKFLFML
jgi:hypothetical protein